MTSTLPSRAGKMKQTSTSSVLKVTESTTGSYLTTADPLMIPKTQTPLKTVIRAKLGSSVHLPCQCGRWNSGSNNIDLVPIQVFTVVKGVREQLVTTTTPRVNVGQMTPTTLASGITSSINISTPATTLTTTLVGINVTTMMVTTTFVTPRNFTSVVVRNPLQIKL